MQQVKYSVKYMENSFSVKLAPVYILSMCDFSKVFGYFRNILQVNADMFLHPYNILIFAYKHYWSVHLVIVKLKN